MLNCIYHPTKEMRVVEDDEYQSLLSSGEWFKSPKEAKEKKEKSHEKRKGKSKC